MNDEVLHRIDALAAKLGVVGEQLWEVLLRQVYVDAAIAAFWMVLLGAGSFFAVRLYVTRKRDIGWDLMDDELEPFGVMGVGMLLILTVIAWGVGTEGIITAILNPEFAALSKILPK